MLVLGYKFAQMEAFTSFFDKLVELILPSIGIEIHVENKKVSAVCTWSSSWDRSKFKKD